MAVAMFIKRNRTRHAGKTYGSKLLIQGKRVPGKRPPGRPVAGSPPPKSVVVHETLANLSKLPEDLIALIEDYCRGKTAASEPAADAASEPATGKKPRRRRKG